MKSYLHEPAATVATGTTRKAAITGTTAAATAASRAASAPVCCSGEWKATPSPGSEQRQGVGIACVLGLRNQLVKTSHPH